jgi:acetyl esterase/lipase
MTRTPADQPAEEPDGVLTRPAPPPDLTVRYGPLPDQVADLRWPLGGSDRPTERTTDAAAPLVVVIHGGFWRAGYDRRHTGPQCAGLAEAGFAVAAIEYRRTGQPGGGWPATFDDVAAALDAVPDLVARAATAAGQAVDTDRTVLVGHSAGGQLAAWAAVAPRPGIVGAVSLAGVLDLTLAARLGLGPGGDPSGDPNGDPNGDPGSDDPGSSDPGGGDPGGGDPGAEPAVQALLGGTPDAVPERYAAVDPARLGAPAVPVLALHGDADRTVPPECSRSYARATGQPLMELPGVGHFDLIDPRSSSWPQVLNGIRAAAGTGRR